MISMKITGLDGKTKTLELSAVCDSNGNCLENDDGSLLLAYKKNGRWKLALDDEEIKKDAEVE